MKNRFVFHILSLVYMKSTTEKLNHLWGWDGKPRV